VIQFPTNKEFLLIIDFEATCSNDNTIKREQMEIIEFAAILTDKINLKIIKEFSEFIRPEINPQLTDFCTELTTRVNN
jgi:inhibitor of KinA sporulation pathway (predicted exonuclease)